MVQLSDSQADLLRHLARQATPVRKDELDGRVVRALRSRKLIEVRNGLVSISEAGRQRLDAGLRPKRRRRFAASAEARSRQARAETIYRAIDALELALPREAEVAVGEIFAYADDVVRGFRNYARTLEEDARIRRPRRKAATA